MNSTNTCWSCRAAIPCCGGERIAVKAGEGYLIRGGVAHSGEVVAGTRTIHAFGGPKLIESGTCAVATDVRNFDRRLRPAPRGAAPKR